MLDSRSGTPCDPPAPPCCCRCALLLQAATCNNVLPVTKPGVKFACPNNRQFDPEKLENVMPSHDYCCSKVRDGSQAIAALVRQ